MVWIYGFLVEVVSSSSQLGSSLVCKCGVVSVCTCTIIVCVGSGKGSEEECRLVNKIEINLRICVWDLDLGQRWTTDHFRIHNYFRVSPPQLLCVHFGDLNLFKGWEFEY